MLPTMTLAEIKKANSWCGYGRRIASAWHRTIGRPQRISAYDVVRALKIKGDKGNVSWSQDLEALEAICRLIDIDTANEIMKEMKRKRYPFNHFRWGENRRNYPDTITRGRQLYELLLTLFQNDRTKLLLSVLKNKVAGEA